MGLPKGVNKVEEYTELYERLGSKANLPGGAAAFGLGGSSTTAITLTTDGTGDAEVALPTGSISGTLSSFISRC